MAKPITAIAEESMAALQAYAWPGNVRELRNLIERAMILTRGPVLRVSLGGLGLDLEFDVGETSSTSSSTSGETTASRDEAERAHLRRALERCGWRIRGPGGATAAPRLKPTTLESRMKNSVLCAPGSFPWKNDLMANAGETRSASEELRNVVA